jgi:hypothetical protein
MSEKKIMNIFEKLSAITSELPKVAKNLQVGEGRFAYKAVSEVDINNAVKPLEEKYKVYSYPVSRNIIETGEIESKTGNKQLFLRIETIYRFVNIENPQEYIDITTYGDGVDPQDKAVGKAMTYGDKYALMKAYKIATGEDPDQEASAELGKMVKKPTKKDDRALAREKFVTFCKTNNVNMVEASKKYKLNTASKVEDFENAMENLKQEIALGEIK